MMNREHISCFIAFVPVRFQPLQNRLLEVLILKLEDFLKGSLSRVRTFVATVLDES